MKRRSESEGAERALRIMRAAATCKAPRETARLYGRPRVEVIAVRPVVGLATHPPYGTVSAFDGKRGQILYSFSEDDDATRLHPCCDAQGALLLAGPYRAISAEGSVAIELDLYYGSDQDRPEHHQEDDDATESIFWDVYSKNRAYDKLITKSASTGCGPVDVTFIVWSNAVQGSIQVRLIQRDGNGTDRDHCCIHGRITAAYSHFPDNAVVLFDSNGTCPTLRYEDLAVPLTRTVIAAPLTKPLTIGVELCDHSDKEIVSGSLVFHPELHRQRRLVGRNGDVVEVTITWAE